MASYKKWLEEMQAKEKNKEIQNNTNHESSNKNNRLSIAGNNNTNNKILESKNKINNNITKNNVMLNDITRTKSSNIQNIDLKEYSNTQNKGNIFTDIGKMFENTWLQMQNTAIDLSNTIGKRITENQNQRTKMINETNKRVLEQYFKKGKINQEEYNKLLNNPLLKETNYQPTNTLKKEGNIKKIQSNAENSSNAVTKYINANIAPAIGGMIPTLIGGGPLYMAGSATGAYYDEGKKRGMSDEEANKYSAKMGMAETLSEMVPVGKIINTTKSAAKQGVKKTLKDIAIVGIENATQESLMEPTSELMAGEKYANWDNIGGRMASSALTGGLVGGILAGTGAGIGSAPKVIEKINNRKNVAPESIQSSENQVNNTSNPIAPKMQENANIQQNEKINNFRQDANKFWISNEQSQGLTNVIEKIITDKGYNIRLDDTINNNGKSVNAQITTLDNNEVEIKINPNAKNSGEFLLMHEITHSIETKEMKDLVLDYAKKNKDFESALNNLKETYNTDDVSSEVVSDISAQLFGNQEFINNLSMEKPSLFKQIYNKIIEWANKLTGNSHEALFVRDLKNKWEEAYRTQNNNLSSKIYNSIEKDAKGYKYVKADRQVISGDNPELWKKQTEKYIDEKIRQNKDIKVYTEDGTELTITKNTSGKATFRNEVRQADGTIRKLTDKEFASKLRAETHIDELGTVSKYKNGPVPDTKKHKFAKDGFTYRDAYFEDIDGQYYKITMSVGKNGDINTIYNVGKMKQTQKNRRLPIRELKGSSGKTTKDRNSSNKSIAPVKNDVNTPTKYSMQESENNSGSFNLPINCNLSL